MGQTVGMEGVWGATIMTITLAVMTSVPGSDHGAYESFPDSVYMVWNSSTMKVLTSTYMMSIALYNFVGMQICRSLSAVTRCLVDCMRTATVWLFQIAIHY